jgi:uncharacterized protein YndB with AHSA1/START domain
MSAAENRPIDQSANDIVITRIFNAPREAVFKAWTDPGHLKRWWAPKGCTTPHCRVDLRVGGKFHYCMRMSDGLEVWGVGVYQQIDVPERIMYTDSFADADGNVVAPSHYGMGDSHPAETLVIVTFTDLGGRTQVTLRHLLTTAILDREGTSQGWSQMLDRLDTLLSQAGKE